MLFLCEVNWMEIAKEHDVNTQHVGQILALGKFDDEMMI